MLLTNCTIPDFTKMEFVQAHIVIDHDVISQVCRDTEPPEGDNETLDCSGMYVCPGLCDGHVHIESSRLSPAVFADCVIPTGTTGVFADPHEIANVLGMEGIELFLKEAEVLPLSLFIGAPSCVPATHLETAGSTVTLQDIEKLLTHDLVYGLAEMMNVPGIIHDIGDARQKVEAALRTGKIVDGHCPGLGGKELAAYITNGKNDGTIRITSDHECTSYKEAKEKYEAGMHIMLRHGSASKDLCAILSGFASDGIFSERLILACDDITARDLREYGHINNVHCTAMNILREQGGLSAPEAFLHALKMCTSNTCAYFGVNAGTVEQGHSADLIVHSSLDKIIPDTVICRGVPVYRDGALTSPCLKKDYSRYTKKPVIDSDMDLSLQTDKGKTECRVIGLVPDSIVTVSETVELKAENGIILPSPEQNIAKLCVIERHRGTGNTGIGFVRGFSFINGAVASTVAHDSHNIIAAGYSDDLIMKAVRLLESSGGGLAAVTETGSCLIPLEIAGLMSSGSAGNVIEQENRMEGFTHSMGFETDPFPVLSFLALPVIPELKLTDKGLVDVSAFDFVPLVMQS